MSSVDGSSQSMALRYRFRAYCIPMSFAAS